MAGLRSGQFVKAMIIAGVVEVVGVVLTLVISYVTKTAPATWGVILVPTTAVVIASIKAGVDAAARAEPKPVPAPYPGGGYTTYGDGVYRPRPAPQQPPAQPAQRGRGGVSLVLVLAVLLVVCGGGGLAVTAGARYGYGWVTGHEAGTAVFEGSAVGTGKGVRVTVTRVEVTSHFTKVELRGETTGTESVSLPLYQNCTLVGASGQTLKADPFRSEWSEEVVSGAPHTGTIVFPGKLPAGNAALSFAHVFVLGGGSLTVQGIALRAV